MKITLVCCGDEKTIEIEREKIRSQYLLDMMGSSEHYVLSCPNVNVCTDVLLGKAVFSPEKSLTYTLDYLICSDFLEYSTESLLNKIRIPEDEYQHFFNLHILLTETEALLRCMIRNYPSSISFSLPEDMRSKLSSLSNCEVCLFSDGFIVDCHSGAKIGKYAIPKLSSEPLKITNMAINTFSDILALCIPISPSSTYITIVDPHIFTEISSFVINGSVSSLHFNYDGSFIIVQSKNKEVSIHNYKLKFHVSSFISSGLFGCSQNENIFMYSTNSGTMVINHLGQSIPHKLSFSLTQHTSYEDGNGFFTFNSHDDENGVKILTQISPSISPQNCLLRWRSFLPSNYVIIKESKNRCIYKIDSIIKHAVICPHNIIIYEDTIGCCIKSSRSTKTKSISLSHPIGTYNWIDKRFEKSLNPVISSNSKHSDTEAKYSYDSE
jgi:hypothetical protein